MRLPIHWQILRRVLRQRSRLQPAHILWELVDDGRLLGIGFGNTGDVQCLLLARSPNWRRGTRALCGNCSGLGRGSPRRASSGLCDRFERRESIRQHADTNFG